jgi:hypothetical protein
MLYQIVWMTWEVPKSDTHDEWRSLNVEEPYVTGWISRITGRRAMVATTTPRTRGDNIAAPRDPLL